MIIITLCVYDISAGSIPKCNALSVPDFITKYQMPSSSFIYKEFLPLLQNNLSPKTPLFLYESASLHQQHPPVHLLFLLYVHSIPAALSKSQT